MLQQRGDGDFEARLSRAWSVGVRPHGGYLMALLAKAGVAAVDPALDPLAISTQFLRPPASGPALISTDIRKKGRRATVVNVVLEQDGRSCVEAALTVGTMPAGQPAYADLPSLAAEPPADAVDLSVHGGGPTSIGKLCDLRMDAASAGFLRQRTDGELRLLMWLRAPGGEPSDPYFALIAGDISVPVTFNLGRVGWSPTVQLTALLRSRPAPGWLRVQVEARAVYGEWFDADATVIDSTGNLVAQARQLALTARS
ncbi:MAG: thioesterase family protein [Sciscionella sp.]